MDKDGVVPTQKGDALNARKGRRLAGSATWDHIDSPLYLVLRKEDFGPVHAISRCHNHDGVNIRAFYKGM
jgi:hypothetical protein